jgi:hypothetical protein
MGTNISLSPLYAWSRKGKRAFDSTPRNWGKNVTLLASITRRGVGPCLAVEGSTTREVFVRPTPGACPGAGPEARAGGGDGITSRLTRAVGCARSWRQWAVSLYTCRPTLAGPQPHRRGVLEGQGAPAAIPRANPRIADRGDGSSVGCGVSSGRLGLFQTLRLPLGGPTAMRDALTGHESCYSRLLS